MTTTNTTQKRLSVLRALYAAFIDYLLRTIKKAKPGTVPPSMLAVVRLVVNDAGTAREVRAQVQARHALAGLKKEAGALSLPFTPPSARQ